MNKVPELVPMRHTCLFRLLAPDNLLAVIPMLLGVPALASQLSDIHQDLLTSPSERIGHEKDVSLDICRNDGAGVLANFLLRLVFGPRADGGLWKEVWISLTTW